MKRDFIWKESEYRGTILYPVDMTIDQVWRKMKNREELSVGQRKLKKAL